MDSGGRLGSKTSVAISKIWLANQGAWANWATWVSSCRLTQKRKSSALWSSSSRIIMTLGATSIRRGLAYGPAAKPRLMLVAPNVMMICEELDRQSTRLNYSNVSLSYDFFFFNTKNTT